MSCCGKGRLQATEARPEGATGARPRAIFVYDGATSMVVVSPVTGRRYHFAGPGARVDVDGRDRPYLMAIPHLRALL